MAADLPRGRGDERRLSQVLLNLLGNALKFTEAGEIRVKAGLEDGQFVVSVADTGPGISASDQARIFEAFQQVDNSLTRKKGGTGLGLSIARRIVELHGGRLWVESAPGGRQLHGHGPGAGRAPGGAMTSAFWSSRTTRRTDASSATSSRAGFEMIEALTGEDGVRPAETERPDLILMDIQLPGLDGYEATRRIKAIPRSDRSRSSRSPRTRSPATR